MESFKVLYTQDGRRNVTVVSYDRKSAADFVSRLPEGTTDIEIIPVKPGEIITVEQPRTGRVVQRKHTVKRV